MIAGALLLLVLPLVMAGIVYALLRWASLAALLSIGTTLALGVAAVALPLDEPVHLWGREIALNETMTLLGRELVLEQADRMAMAILFFTAAGLFLLAWRFEPHSLIFPMGLGLLSLLCGALLIRPLIYAALLVEIAAALSIFALQIENGGPTRGGLRYLTFTTLALPGLLVTHWLLERYALTPDETGLLGTAAILLGISFALLLGVVPFHTWTTTIADDSAPLSSAFVLTINNGAVWFLLLNFLETYPWLSDHPGFSSTVSTAGLAMLIVGTLLAPAQRRPGSLMGYGALIDSGAALLALALGSETGLTLLILSLITRPFGLLLMAAGLSGLRSRSGNDDRPVALRGQGWKAPWSTAALFFGGLSLAGLPISAGFVWRWPLARALASAHQDSVLFLFLAGAGVMVGVWREMAVLLVRPRAPKNRSVLSLDSSEGWLTAAVVILAIIACVGGGIFPQAVAPMAARLAATYTFFAP